MDLLEFICIMTAILAIAGLIFVWMSTKNAIILQDLAEKRRIALERSKAAKARYDGPDSSDIAPWVSDLLSGIGISPESLFSDEMPPEVAKFIPMVKGFVESGGIQKILAQTGGGTEKGPGTQGFI